MSVEVTTTGGTMVSTSTGSGVSVSLTASSTSVSVASPAVNFVDVISTVTLTDHDNLLNSGTLTHAQLETAVNLNTAKVSDKTKTHIQGVSSPVWIVTHNLNKYPSVTVTDSAGTIVIGLIEYNSLDQITLTFKATFSGEVHFN